MLFPSLFHFRLKIASRIVSYGYRAADDAAMLSRFHTASGTAVTHYNARCHLAVSLNSPIYVAQLGLQQNPLNYKVYFFTKIKLYMSIRSISGLISYSMAFFRADVWHDCPETVMKQLIHFIRHRGRATAHTCYMHYHVA